MEPYDNKDNQQDLNHQQGEIPEYRQPETDSVSSAGENMETFSQQPSQPYHTTGAGQKESPYANSPYYTSYQAGGQNGYTVPPQPPKEKKPHRKMNATAKHVIAAAVAVAVMAGSCGATAVIVNHQWEQRHQETYQEMNRKIQDLEHKLGQANASSGNSISGSPVSSTDSLTPSQVYAQNVNSVVAIANQSTTNVFGQVTEMASSGSGFVLTEDGYIISNYHVVEGASTLTVMTYMGDEYPAQIVGYDQMNDVSLLKVEASGLQPVKIGSSDALIVGDQVVAIGNPLGELTSSLTVGYISAKDRTINTDGNLINMMQTDAAINPGNSGGPLFNMKGEVVGITTAKFSGNTSSGASIEGIGFAIPIDDVMGMMSDLKEYGYLKNQAYLGITVLNMDSNTANMYSLPTGSYVQSVVEGGSADRAGVQAKDIIIAVGEYEVDGNATLTRALRRFNAGDTTTITVFRAGQEINLDITLDERPEEIEPSADQNPPAQQIPQMPEGGMNPFDFFSPFFGG